MAGFSLANRQGVRTSVKYKIIYRHKDKFSISELCRFFVVSRSGYYSYVSRMDIPSKDLPLAKKIIECQDKCGKTYGYRRVHIWLERNGIHHNPKTILRVMQNTICFQLSGERNTAITVSNCTNTQTCLTGTFMQINLMRNGLRIFHTSRLHKEQCICQSSEICMTTVSCHTRQEPSRI